MQNQQNINKMYIIMKCWLLLPKGETNKMMTNVKWNISFFFRGQDSHNIEGLFLLRCKPVITLHRLAHPVVPLKL